jgi:hypothetical protein
MVGSGFDSPSLGGFCAVKREANMRNATDILTMGFIANDPPVPGPHEKTINAGKKSLLPQLLMRFITIGHADRQDSNS